MKKHDRMSAFFFVVLATAICVESIRLGPGSFSNPGPGLLPLGCGLFLGFLGIVQVAVSMKGFTEGQTLLWKPGTRWRCLISIPVSLVAYAFLLDILGFHLVTFFLDWLYVPVGWANGMEIDSDRLGVYDIFQLSSF